MFAVTANPLVALEKNLDDAIAAIVAGDSDLKTLDDLLGKVSQALGYPGKLDGDLKKIQGPLTTIQSLANDVSILPVIGPPSRAVSTVLKPMVKPKPPGGILGEARAILGDIDKALKPIKSGFSDLRKPIHDVQSVVGKILLKFRQFRSGVDYLIRVHGDHPPEGVVSCAQKLNAIVEEVMSQFRKAYESVRTMIDAFTSLAHVLDGVLDAIHRVIDGISRIVDTMTSGAVKQLTSALDAIEKQLGKLKRLGEWAFRQALKLMGIDIDKLVNALRSLEAKAEHFLLDPLKAQLEKARDSVVREIQKIPAVQKFEKALEDFEKALEDLRDKVENGIGKKCADLLTPVGAREAYPPACS